MVEEKGEGKGRKRELEEEDPPLVKAGALKREAGGIRGTGTEVFPGVKMGAGAERWKGGIWGEVTQDM